MGIDDHTMTPADDAPGPPLNQEPGTAAPLDGATAGGYAVERSNEEAGNEGPEEMPGFGQARSHRRTDLHGADSDKVLVFLPCRNIEAEAPAADPQHRQDAVRVPARRA